MMLQLKLLVRFYLKSEGDNMADKGNLYLKNNVLIGLYDSTKAYETTVQETLYSQYKTAFKISKSY